MWIMLSLRIQHLPKWANIQPRSAPIRMQVSGAGGGPGGGGRGLQHCSEPVVRGRMRKEGHVDDRSHVTRDLPRGFWGCWGRSLFKPCI